MAEAIQACRHVAALRRGAVIVWNVGGDQGLGTVVGLVLGGLCIASMLLHLHYSIARKVYFGSAELPPARVHYFSSCRLYESREVAIFRRCWRFPRQLIKDCCSDVDISS
jgi:hypothetical protein